jgi:hypothetical protein
MWLQTLVLLAVLSVASAPALANGRFPATVDVHIDHRNSDRMLLPSTWGLLLSTDGGASFRWVCEDAIGYTGAFDPDYAFDSEGAIYATTYDGIKVSRDQGCTWKTVPGALADQFAAAITVGPTGHIWVATATGGKPNDVFVSKDNGATFTPTGLFHESGWWRSVATDHTTGERVYVTGYVVASTLPDGGMSGPVAMFRRSNDGGQTWTELPIAGFQTGKGDGQIYVAAVSPSDPDIVFVRAVGAASPGDIIYRSTNGGQDVTEVLRMADVITGFVIRADGTTVIAGTVGSCAGDPVEPRKGCVRISNDGGQTFAPAATEPEMACLTERSDGVLFACGANWEPDNFALGRSTDAAQWSKVVRFSEIAGPVSCPAGTVQYDTCESLQWPSFVRQFGIDGPDAGPGNGATDASVTPPKKPGGGCGCNLGPLAAVLIVLPTGRRRRALR